MLEQLLHYAVDKSWSSDNSAFGSEDRDESNNARLSIQLCKAQFAPAYVSFNLSTATIRIV